MSTLQRVSGSKHRWRGWPALVLLLVGAGCAGIPELDQASQLSQRGQHEQAWQLLSEASRRMPGDAAVRSAELRQRELAVAALLMQAEVARAGGQAEAALGLLQRAQALHGTHPKVMAFEQSLARELRQARQLSQAQRLADASRHEDARQALRPLLADAPGHPGARALLGRLQDRAEAAVPPPAATVTQRPPITLEFRDAPLRSVLDALARTNGLNFVFDREVRGDGRVTVHLRGVSLDDALKVILSTQGLTSKALNAQTLLIYPNTAPKQREHQELVTRTFYLANADVKQAQALVRAIAKTRDLFVDERLNLLVVRDTADAVLMVQRLIESIDLAEPEVMLDVEVLEVASNRLDELGLQWPEQVSLGLLDGSATAPLGRRSEFRAAVANPALLATLRETAVRSNTLANPRLRARNREKAKVLIGEKLPVFTTTSTANVGVSASVSYLDVGLKLEVEPSVQLDNDVVMKVALEVSTLIGRVAGPQGSVGYQIGTRQASTSLRLRDGETQVLAGLIRDDDGKTVSGVPGLAELPVVGRLFGLHSDQRVKTEVVLLITPRVVRNLALPEFAHQPLAAGVEATPGTSALRLSDNAAVRVDLARAGTGTATRASRAPLPGDGARGGSEEARAPATLELAASESTPAGGVASVTLANRSEVVIRGELSGDASFAAAGVAGAP
ncbi:MAG: secretin and TonB N-terminal domain-containing protein, partial [Aquabacterium sp.]